MHSELETNQKSRLIFPTHEASCCVNEDTKMESEEAAFTFIKTFGFCVPIIF